MLIVYNNIEGESEGGVHRIFVCYDIRCYKWKYSPLCRELYMQGVPNVKVEHYYGVYGTVCQVINSL